MRRMRINGKRTVSNGRYLSAAVLFCVGLVFLYGCFHEKQSGSTAVSAHSRYVVVTESLAGREEVPLEEYLIGALAVTVPEDFSAQACRAQAVILRTNAVWFAQEAGSERIYCQDLGQNFLTVRELEEKWGDAYAEQYEKLADAVYDTRDQIMQYEGIPVELPYFPLSAGMTRSGEGLALQETYPYLQSVPCTADPFSEHFEQEIILTQSEIAKTLGEMFDSEEEVAWEDIELVWDSAGYVTEMTWKEKRISGEQFRAKLGLASACFTVEQDKNRLYIVTKGIGHGLGMSLYEANEMGKEGKEYQEILGYFFPDCEIVKN